MYSEFDFYEEDIYLPERREILNQVASLALISALIISFLLALLLWNLSSNFAYAKNAITETAREATEEKLVNSVDELVTVEEANSIDGKKEAKNPRIAPLFTPEVQFWAPKIVSWAKKWNLDPNLVATVMQIESCGNPAATSTAGAMGLFQVMPFHFISGEDGYDPKTNATRGLSYLSSSLLSHNGNAYLALAGYNGGINGSKRPQSMWPNETVRYVYWGSGIYDDAKNGRLNSARLDEWLQRGGASLCDGAGSYLGLQDN